MLIYNFDNMLNFTILQDVFVFSGYNYLCPKGEILN